MLSKLEQLRIRHGDRIAIVGHNGCGKSSLLQHLWREYQLSDERPVVFHSRVRIGYYHQSLHQLHDEDTLSEALTQFASLNEEQRKWRRSVPAFPTPAISSRFAR